MKKLMLMVFGIFLLISVSATLPSIEQNTCIELRTISNTTSVTLSSITYPNETTIYLDNLMTKQGKTFNYTFCSTLLLGTYVYDYYKNTGEVYVNDFKVTSNGQDGSNNIWLFIIAFALLYGLNLLGFFNRNIPLTILSGMGMIFFGIYLLNNGIIVYRDTLTNYLAYITIGWGFISSMWAAFEQLEIL